MKLDNVIAERKTKTVYRDGKKCIKVFNEKYSKADVLNEALNTARIEDIGLNIPKIIEVATVDGKWAIVSEFIEGETLADLMKKNPKKEQEYLELFTELQIKVQKCTGTGLTKLKDKMSERIKLSGLDASVRYEMLTRLEGMPKHNKVCHGDFDPSNVIIDNKGKAYILDWAHVTQGNASADVARTYMYFCMNKQQELADKYLDMFCKKTDTAKQYVQKWMPLVAAAHLTKATTKKDKEFLLKWCDVVESL